VQAVLFKYFKIQHFIFFKELQVKFHPVQKRWLVGSWNIQTMVFVIQTLCRHSMVSLTRTQYLRRWKIRQSRTQKG